MWYSEACICKLSIQPDREQFFSADAADQDLLAIDARAWRFSIGEIELLVLDCRVAPIVPSHFLQWRPAQGGLAG
ncbi:hypothetical protein, partial [Erythrobacter sp.]|uniref:hypothetical protein n=1 Tax=Erythrobacter sp. TaxID=1042 RepID=UPI0025F3E608